jgi:hypothetical protein
MGRPLKHHITIGARFGYRTILREMPKTASNVHRRVEVQCDCGDISTTEYRALLVGVSHGCFSCSFAKARYGSVEAAERVRDERADQLSQARAEHALRASESAAVAKAMRDARLVIIKQLLADGLSQAEVARRVGLSRTSISRIRHGLR